MLSIGELAQRTGVSRRMLRHWEDLGLISPAHVDRFTGRRSYEDRQAGRVRAIAALRAVGFGLDDIADLLESEITQSRLIELLQQREIALQDEIAVASTRLAEVQSRLADIQKGHEAIMNTLTLTTLPELTLLAAQEHVQDETEIPDAVARLQHQLREAHIDTTAVHLIYDGSSDDFIAVTVGVQATSASALNIPASLTVISIPSAAGAVVQYRQHPGSIGDAWVAIGGELEDRGLRTTSPYRQEQREDGTVTLSVPAHPLPH